jgi:hypothetical protein
VLGLAGKNTPGLHGDRVGSGQTGRVSQSGPISTRNPTAGRVSWTAVSAGDRSGGRLGEQAVGETDEIGGEVATQRVTQDRAQML